MGMHLHVHSIVTADNATSDQTYFAPNAKPISALYSLQVATPIVNVNYPCNQSRESVMPFPLVALLPKDCLIVQSNVICVIPWNSLPWTQESTPANATNTTSWTATKSVRISVEMGLLCNRNAMMVIYLMEMAVVQHVILSLISHAIPQSSPTNAKAHSCFCTKSSRSLRTPSRTLPLSNCNLGIPQFTNFQSLNNTLTRYHLTSNSRSFCLTIRTLRFLSMGWIC